MQSEHTIATTSTATKMNYTQLNNRNMAPPPPSSSSQAKYRDVNGRHRDDQVKTMLIMARRKLRHHNRCGANTVKATAPASWRQSRYISWTALTMVVVAVMVVSPLLMLLLVDLVGAETAAQGHQLVHTANGQRHIIKTRSNLGEDEEELTIGQQPFDSHEDEPPPQSQGTTMGDLWPMGSRHQSPEGAQQQQHHHPSTAAVVQSAEAQSARLPKKRENDNMDDVFDPFAPVFDDYLREASGTTRFSDSDDLSEFGVTQQLQTGRSKDDDDLDNQIIAGRTGLSAELIEDDDQTTTNTNNNNNNDMNSPARAVDRISGEEGSSDRRQQFADNGARETLLPSEAATSVNHHESSDEQNRLQTTTGQNHRAQDTSENNNNNINNKETGAPNDAGTQLANEIRLLFAWHSMPTNKCSKSCGRGLRVMHLICKDLKYDVRVEDELCLRANLGRPSELSDEPCNEIDCEPNWEEVAIERCNSNQDDGSISNNNNNGDGVVSRKTLPREECRSKSVFKRLECTMINRFGETIRLGESRCNATTTATSDNHSKYSSSSTPPSTDEEFSLIDLNEEIDKERNSILSNDVLFNLESHHGDRHHHSMTTGGQLSTTGTQPMRSGGSSGGSAWSKHFRSNEPFYEPGEWSECSGAPCGQLGRRRRQLTCRLFLSRSSRFVDLPDASCASSAADEPDREEPCYMDCGPSTGYSVAVASAAAPEPHSTDQPKQLAAPSSSGDESQHHHHHNQHDKSSNAELTLPSHKQQVESALEAGIKPADLDDETIYDLEAARYGWRHGAWTKCSAECLRGTSESIVECWDKVAETSVDEKFCNSLTKPGPISKTCNEIPCAFQWHPGPFSSCSSACGSAGVRVREVLCVRRTPVTGATLVNIYQQQHHGHHTGGLSESGPLDGSRANNDASAGSAATAPAYHLEIVPEEHCIEQQQLNNTSASSSSGPITATATTSANTNSSSSSSQQQNHHHVKPHSMEPCNRHDCKPQWQVGPWGECSVSGRCGRAAEHGVRNRTVICVQEFASQYGPSNKLDGMINDTEQHDASISPDLREAISLAAASWQPGKAIQVPYSECYRHYHSVPPISEHCREDQGKACPVRDDEARLTSTIGGGGASTAAAETMETASGSIDSDPLQDFRMISADGRLLSGGHHNQLRRRTITLKVGGRAQIMEGWNVKIRCRLTKRPTTTTTPNQNNQHQHQSGKQEASVSSGLVSKQASLVSSANYFGSGSSTRAQVEWRKDGVRIFAPNTTVAEKQLLEDTDNSIQNYGNDEMNRQEDDTYSMMAADEPPEAKLGHRHQRAFVRERRPGVSGGSRSNHQQQQQRLATASAKTNSRVLRVRSWSSSLAPAPELSSFQFVAQKGGRFSLVKENTLRIKRLKLDDSGLYTCTSGPFSESIEINVVGRRRLSSAGLDQNQASPNNYNQ